MRDRPIWVSLLGLATAVAAAVGALSNQDAAPPSTVDAPRAGEFVVLDPFGSTASDVARYRRVGYSVRCFLRAGVWEGTRPDAARFDPEILGLPAPGGGRWLDLRRWDKLGPILDDRLALCVAKGFDGVMVSGLDGMRTGFDLTAADRDTFLHRLEALAEARRLTLTPAPTSPPDASPDGVDAVGSAGKSRTSGS